MFQPQDFNEGVHVTIDHLPGKGAQFWIDGATRGSIDNPAFSTTLFKVWLGDHPADSDLKSELLSQIP